MHGVEKSRARAREARKMHFCTTMRVYANANCKLEFDDAERLSGRSDDNRTQKFSNYVHISKMRSKNKVALAVELSIIMNQSPWERYGESVESIFSQPIFVFTIHMFHSDYNCNTCAILLQRLPHNLTTVTAFA